MSSKKFIDMVREAQSQKIKTYSSNFAKAFLEGKVPPPSGQDCWDCLFRDLKGDTMGELGDSSTHLLSHIFESYFVPSLLLRALEVTSTPLYLSLVEDIWDKTRDLKTLPRNVLKDLELTISKSLRSYITSQLRKEP